MKINILETICGPDGVLRPGEHDVDEVLARNLISVGAAIDLSPGAEAPPVVSQGIETAEAVPALNAMTREG